MTLLLVLLKLNERQPLSDSFGYRDSRTHFKPPNFGDHFSGVASEKLIFCNYI